MYRFDMHPSKRGVSQECPNCGACKESVEHVLPECTSYHSQRQIFGTIYVSNKSLLCKHSKLSITVAFSTKLFCLGEKQGTLLNNGCSSRYNRAGDFLMSAWDRRKEIL